MLKFPDFSPFFRSNIKVPDFSRFSRLRSNPETSLRKISLKNEQQYQCSCRTQKINGKYLAKHHYSWILKLKISFTNASPFSPHKYFEIIVKKIPIKPLLWGWKMQYICYKCYYIIMLKIKTTLTTNAILM